MRKTIVMSLALLLVFAKGSLAQSSSNDFLVDNPISRSTAGVELVQSGTNNPAPRFVSVSIEQLKNDLNSNFSTFGLSSDYRLRKYEYEKGKAFNAAKFKIKDNFLVSVFLNKDDESVRTFILALIPKDDEVEDALLALLAAMKTFNPDMENKEVESIVLQLLKDDEEFASHVKDGIKITISKSSRLVGIWFFAEPESL